MNLPAPGIVWSKRLLWAYFYLWVFEGVLRKWLVPSLSNPLLVIRDPIVLSIYAIAVSRGFFPRNHFVTAFTILGTIFTFVGALVLPEAPAVVAFGFRTNFLHIPLLFLIPKIWDRTDVQRVGQIVLALSVPMALLMALQFLASPDAWLNRGAGGEEGAQITAALGHIRPAGTFTFILGPVVFFSLVAAFLLSAQFAFGADRLAYPRYLVGSAFAALLLAMVVSGSRSTLASVAIVVGTAVISATMIRPRLLLRLFQAALLLGIATVIFSRFGIFQEGLDTLTNRIVDANQAEGGSSGFLRRSLQDFTKPMELWSEIPAFGFGLGMGTNVGAKLLVGDRNLFLLAENEWSRVLMESGPVLGSLYLLFRSVLAINIGFGALRIGRLRGDALPSLLFGASGLHLVIGQWGQPTELGFSIFVSGLVLAAMGQERSGAAVSHSRKPALLPVAGRASSTPAFGKGRM